MKLETFRLAGNSPCLTGIFSAVLAVSSAHAATVFTASLDESSVVSPTGSPATAVATMTLAQPASGPTLSYSIQLNGLDLDGLQTPANVFDDVTAIHFHRAPQGDNGPHVLNVFGFPREDDADMTFDPIAGTVAGFWDDPDENLTGAPTLALSDALSDLLAGNVYIQVHTVDFPAGAIRGQVIPEPASAMLLGIALLNLSVVRRRGRS